MKEMVKNKFQDYKKLVPCIEENTICEDSGFNKEIEGKINLKFKEEIKDICEEQITVHEENLNDKKRTQM